MNEPEMSNRVIAICGDSGSGKTTLSKLLEGKLGNCTILECDRYHKWERGSYHYRYLTPLHPRANEIEMMISDVERLRRGETVHRRDYNHSDGKFTDPESIEPKDNIIVSGLHTLKVDYDISIYVDTEKNLKYVWKINRDFKERGYDVDDIIKKVKDRQIEFNNHILPQKYKSDIIVKYYWDKQIKKQIIVNNKVDITKQILEAISE